MEDARGRLFSVQFTGTRRKLVHGFEHEGGVRLFGQVAPDVAKCKNAEEVLAHLAKNYTRELELYWPQYTGNPKTATMDAILDRPAGPRWPNGGRTYE